MNEGLSQISAFNPILPASTLLWSLGNIGQKYTLKGILGLLRFDFFFFFPIVIPQYVLIFRFARLPIGQYYKIQEKTSSETDVAAYAISGTDGIGWIGNLRMG